MTRLLNALVVTTVCAAGIASAAPDPDSWAPDSKEAVQAIHDRGIVLAAGKRHYIVVVPRVNKLSGAPEGAIFSGGALYFGDATKLYFLGSQETKLALAETAWIHSPLTPGELSRTKTSWTLACDNSSARREIELAAVHESAKKLLPSPTLVRYKFPYEPYLFAREEHGTTYYLVDRPTTSTYDNLEFRLFVGKRGAMKQVSIKEQASDFEADILVTSKGTLTVRKKPPVLNQTQNPAFARADAVLFGTEKKRSSLQILDILNNRTLVYRNLGVYTQNTDGLPCEVL